MKQIRGAAQFTKAPNARRQNMSGITTEITMGLTGYYFNKLAVHWRQANIFSFTSCNSLYIYQTFKKYFLKNNVAIVILFVSEKQLDAFFLHFNLPRFVTDSVGPNGGALI